MRSRACAESLCGTWLLMFSAVKKTRSVCNLFVNLHEHFMEEKIIIITIDGWSSCGKSTLARQLAKALNYVYIDSGAMYRAITLYFLRNHVDWTDKKEVKKALKQINIEFQ